AAGLLRACADERYRRRPEVRFGDEFARRGLAVGALDEPPEDRHRQRREQGGRQPRQRALLPQAHPAPPVPIGFTLRSSLVGQLFGSSCNRTLRRPGGIVTLFVLATSLLLR